MELATWMLLVPYQLLQIAFGKSSRNALGERLGSFAKSPTTSARRLLIHAVSAGEMNAASAVIHELAMRGWKFALSAGNRDARSMAERIATLHHEVERVVWFPWDRRGSMARLLEATEPDAVVVMETELWPGLLDAGSAAGIPVVIAGARIENSAARRYRLVRRFFAPMLRGCSSILAINERERAKFIAIGAPSDIVEIAGDLKAEACLASHETTALVRERRLIVAASTHPGEEEIILEAFRRISEKFSDARLIIAPRHVRRARSIQRFAPQSVEVIDRLGVLAQLYLTAEIVIVGGTFVPVGGHELFGPGRTGAAVVVGPHIENIRENATAMAHAGAIVKTTSAQLPDVLDDLMQDEARRRRLGEQARQFVEARRGAARVTAEQIERLVSGKLSSAPARIA
jgi:3-deoxy-D-manno-octulosonic-acid transferase